MTGILPGIRVLDLSRMLSGRFAVWPAHDLLAQALAGLNSVPGPNAAHPAKTAPAIAEIRL